MPEDTKALLKEVHEMNGKIDLLSTRVNVGHQAIRRLSRLTKTCVALLIAGLVASYFIIDLYQGVSTAQTTTCENRNESAQASLQLWNFVIDASSTGEHTAREEQFFDDMRAYVDALYAPRDCSDLERKYPAPAPPKVPGSQQ